MMQVCGVLPGAVDAGVEKNQKKRKAVVMVCGTGI